MFSRIFKRNSNVFYFLVEAMWLNLINWFSILYMVKYNPWIIQRRKNIWICLNGTTRKAAATEALQVASEFQAPFPANFLKWRWRVSNVDPGEPAKTTSNETKCHLCMPATNCLKCQQHLGMLCFRPCSKLNSGEDPF